MLRTYLLLALAIALEMSGTAALPLADGFRDPVWSVVVVAGYGTSIAVFARAVARGLGLGVGYATLTGAGLAAAALLGVVVLGEGLPPLHALALVLLVVGVLLLQRPRPTIATS